MREFPVNVCLDPCTVNAGHPCVCADSHQRDRWWVVVFVPTVGRAVQHPRSCGQLPGRVPDSLHGQGRVPSGSVWLPRAWRHQHLCWYTQGESQADSPVLCGAQLCRNTLHCVGNSFVGNTLHCVGNSFVGNTLHYVGNIFVGNILCCVRNSLVGNTLCCMGYSFVGNTLHSVGNSFVGNTLCCVRNSLVGNTLCCMKYSFVGNTLHCVGNSFVGNTLCCVCALYETTLHYVGNSFVLCYRQPSAASPLSPFWHTSAIAFCVVHFICMTPDIYKVMYLPSDLHHMYR